MRTFEDVQQLCELVCVQGAHHAWAQCCRGCAHIEGPCWGAGHSCGEGTCVLMRASMYGSVVVSISIGAHAATTEVNEALLQVNLLQLLGSYTQHQLPRHHTLAGSGMICNQQQY